MLCYVSVRDVELSKCIRDDIRVASLANSTVNRTAWCLSSRPAYIGATRYSLHARPDRRAVVLHCQCLCCTSTHPLAQGLLRLRLHVFLTLCCDTVQRDDECRQCSLLSGLHESDQVTSGPPLKWRMTFRARSTFPVGCCTSLLELEQWTHRLTGFFRGAWT